MDDISVNDARTRFCILFNLEPIPIYRLHSHTYTDSIIYAYMFNYFQHTTNGITHRFQDLILFTVVLFLLFLLFHYNFVFFFSFCLFLISLVVGLRNANITGACMDDEENGETKFLNFSRFCLLLPKSVFI